MPTWFRGKTHPYPGSETHKPILHFALNQGPDCNFLHQTGT